MWNPLGQLRTLVRRIRGRMHARKHQWRDLPPEKKKTVVDEFHKLYYDGYRLGITWKDTSWMGVSTEKCPLDLWLYQEIVHELRPDLIIETGTCLGGSAFFMAHMCDLVGKGQVVTIDIEDRDGRPQHDRLEYLCGSSVDEGIVERVRAMTEGAETVLVLLDSDHRKDHVAKELEVYSPFVTRGSYLIVEDTNINGHPVGADFGPGPMEALDEFLATTNEFVIDEGKEKFYLTFSPRGYLRRTG